MAKTTIAGPSGDDASLARAAALLDVPGVIEALDAPYEPPADPPEPEPPAGPPAAVPEPAEALSEPPQVVKGSGGVTLPKFGVSNG